MTKPIVKCQYCRAGNIANEKGEHWIVKSVFPPKISIYQCKAVTREVRR